MFFFVWFCFFFLAVEGEDYTTVSPDMLEVIFPTGTTDRTVLCDSLSIINDDNLEGTHQFSVHIIEVTPDLMNLVTTDPVDTTVEITDDEGGCCSQMQEWIMSINLHVTCMSSQLRL